MADPRSFATQGSTSAWNSSLDDIFCDCGEVVSENSVYPNAPHPHSSSYNSQDIINPELMSPGSSAASVSPGFTRTPMESNIDLYGPYGPYATIPNDISLPSPVINTQPPMVTCMWANCNAAFNSLSDLVGHVNLQHLRFPSPTPVSSASHSSETQRQQNASMDALSCLWGDCNLYTSPDSIPGPSTGNQFDAALSILASHLFQDHLGLPDNIAFAHVPVPQSPAPFETTSSIGIPTPPDSTSTSLSDSPDPAAAHECSGTHACHWKSCPQTFTSCDELTAHITSAHVGGGKSHYECFWDGCQRHGGQGFSSKQKICRHIQVTVFPFIFGSRR
jgi:hypothetical protein